MLCEQTGICLLYTSLIDDTIQRIDAYDKNTGDTLSLTDISNMEDQFDADDQGESELFTFGRKVKIEIGDMDYVSWRRSLVKDRDVLELLTLMVGDITPQYDSKLQKLLQVLKNKIENPINPGNRKVIIFTAFADTAEYLYENVSPYMLETFGLHTAMVSGNVEGLSLIHI